MAPHVRTFDPSTLADCRPYYSPVSTVQGPVKLIYTAGQVGRDKNGVTPSSYEEQVQLAFENLGECLLAAGATQNDIVKLTYYIVGYSPQNRYHAQVLLKFLKGHRPPSTLIPVAALAKPEYLFEIEAVAAIRDLTAIPPIIKPGPAGSLSVDVVVVGGGLSGLQAAHDVQRAGYSCVVLEARDRVGGKTWSQPTKGGSVVDVGAAWINDSNQSRMFALARRFDLKLIEQPSDGNCLAHAPERDSSIVFPYGEVPKFSDKDVSDIVRIRDMFESLCQTIDIRKPWSPKYDDITLEEFHEAARGGNKSTGNGLYLDESDARLRIIGAQCPVLPRLLQERRRLTFKCALIGRMAVSILGSKQEHSHFRSNSQRVWSQVSVILGTPVSRVAQSSSGAVVTTENGTRYYCQKVIVSVPTPTYKEIIFSPPLPLDKLKYSSSTLLGYYAKVILVWEKPWWRKFGYCGMTQSFVGPASVTRDTSDDSLGQFSLTCFIVGEPGRAWSKLSAAGRKEAILSQLVSLFGSENEGDIRVPVEVFEHEWVKDPWSRGCPCPVAPPNVMSEFGPSLRTPFDAVHFVGTETSFEWKGYMEGAVRSGERGAAEVVEALRAKEPRTLAKL